MIKKSKIVSKAAIQGALGSGKGQKLFGKDKKGDVKNTLADRIVGKIKRKAQKSVGLTPTTPKAAARTREEKKDFIISKKKSGRDGFQIVD